MENVERDTIIAELEARAEAEGLPGWPKLSLVVLSAQRGDMDLARAMIALTPRQKGQRVTVDEGEWARMLAVVPEAEREQWGRLGGALCLWGDPQTLEAVESLLRRRTAH